MNSLGGPLSGKIAIYLAVSLLFLGGCGPEARVRKGRDAIQQHDLVKAESAYRQALKMDPDHTDALYGLGWTYYLAGEPSMARPYFERCIQLAPHSPLGYKGLGSLAMAEGNLLLAEERFQQALDRAPGDTALLNSLALLRMKSGRLRDAEAIFKELRQREPDNPTIAIGQCELLLKMKKAPDALDIVDGVLAGDKLEPAEHAMLLQMRGRLLVALTARRVDKERCSETAPPVLAYLQQALDDFQEAENLGVPLPDLPSARRLALRRRSVVSEMCPEAGNAGAAEVTGF